MSEKKELKEEDIKKVSGGNNEKYDYPDSVTCQHCKGTTKLESKSSIIAVYKCPKCNYWTYYKYGELLWCLPFYPE